ncbi:hypothetical protein GCM10010129_01830 [Streptomyces fumigatiscleroticus]|nr:hypothetical protein GCM10010129_01830 [Streptomyces fumigatiscleroticus]
MVPTADQSQAPDARATARSAPPGRAAGTEILRVLTDARTPVFVTVFANGRRRYSYWRPLDSGTGRGGCYVALPTADCDELYASGRITLGDPVTDPTRTTYRVRAVRTPAAPVRAVRMDRGGGMSRRERRRAGDCAA